MDITEAESLYRGEVINRFTEYCKESGYDIKEPAQLVDGIRGRPLFTCSGMQQFMPYFLLAGSFKMESRGYATMQPCIRIDGKDSDLDAIGKDPTHTSLFMMLGHFTFGESGGDEVVAHSEAVRWVLLFIRSILGNSVELTVKGRVNPGFSKDWVNINSFDDCGKLKFEECGLRWDASCADGHLVGDSVEIFYKDIELWNIVKVHTLDSSGNKEFRGIDSGGGLGRLCLVKYMADKNVSIDKIENPSATVDLGGTIQLLLMCGLRPGAKGAENSLRKLIRTLIRVKKEMRMRIFGHDNCAENYLKLLPMNLGSGEFKDVIKHEVDLYLHTRGINRSIKQLLDYRLPECLNVSGCPLGKDFTKKLVSFAESYAIETLGFTRSEEVEE